MPETPADQLKDAETDEAIWLEAAERFRLASEAEGENRANAIEDLEFADGQQWPDDLYKQRRQNLRPSLTINHTETLVKRVVNNMRQQRPRIKVHPVSDAKIEDAKVAAGLIRHIETLSKASVAYDTGGESAVRIGWGYWRILADYPDANSFDQELFIKPVRNTMTVYIDPSAMMPDGSDADWCLISIKMKRTDAKRNGIKLEDWTQTGTGDNRRQWENKQEVRLAEYYRIKKVSDTLLQLADGRAIYASQYNSKREIYEMAGLIPVDGMSRATERRQLQWFKLNGSKVVDKRNLPGQWVPVIRCEGNTLDLNGEVRRKGMIRDLKDPARMFNYWETAKTEKLALSSKAPWVVAEGMTDGHQEWDDANQKPYSKLIFKLVKDAEGNPLPLKPERMAAVEVEAGFAEAAQSAVQNLMMVAGMPHEPMQDAPGTVVSGVALRRRQALSDISHFQYYDNQTMSIAHTGRILLDLIPYYYSTQKMQRIIGEDGVPQMVQINEKVPRGTEQGIFDIKNDLQTGRFDVVMDTGPGYETKRQESAEAMIDLMKTPIGEAVAKAAPDVVVRSMDFPDADSLADRLMPMNDEGMKKAIEKLPKEAQGMVMSLQAQVQEQAKVIQEQALEIKFKTAVEKGWMDTELRKELMRSHTKVKDTDTKAKTAEDVAHIGAQAKINVAEIGAAGQLLNTNTEAAHDRRAAQEMIDAGQQAAKANGAA